MVKGMLLDTNYVSKWQNGEVEPPGRDNIAASTTTLQELYNMQALEGWGYRYLVPYLSGSHVYTWRVLERRMLRDRRALVQQGIAWANSTDKLLVNFPAELADHGFVDTHEKSHQALAILQGLGAVRTIQGIAALAISKDVGRIVGDHFQFVSQARIAPIPVTGFEVNIAIELLNDFIATGDNLKLNRRNSFNDMLILATALRHDMELKTDDRLLLKTALRAGMAQTDDSEGFATLVPVHVTESRERSKESKRYLNSLWRSRRPATDPPE